MTKKTFSIVVPFYQNSENIPFTIPRLYALAELLPTYQIEFVFVEDGSKDDTFNLLRDEVAKTTHNVKLLKLTKNFGQIAALRAGLEHASGDCVGIISADLQDPPELFVEMLNNWEKGYKLVIAERNDRDEGWLQSVLSNSYWKMVNKYALPNYPIGGFDFCLLDRIVAQRISSLTERNTQIFPLIFSLGYSFHKIPYTRSAREHGESQWTLNMKIKLFIDTFIAFSYLPIRLISLIGFVVAIGSLSFGLFMTLQYILYGNPFTGWTSLIVLISLIGGMILITLGIIGEYLWRILDQIRKRPIYIVDESIEKKRSLVF